MTFTVHIGKQAGVGNMSRQMAVTFPCLIVGFVFVEKLRNVRTRRKRDPDSGSVA